MRGPPCGHPPGQIATTDPGLLDPDAEIADQGVGVGQPAVEVDDLAVEADHFGGFGVGAGSARRASGR
ncbi:hypothetical protein [Actinoplanes sp. G11-F43]|uniref:hypothetical protein n=1 Tax=Actinoplanes sp. G11-F43 TaxID=3424130 RepID=UPI003D34EFA4